MGLRKDNSRDGGFTVVEVVVAAAIMFFVLTAIIGLMGASSTMTVMAKQRAVMTNAVASYLDGLRVANWDEVVQPTAPVTMIVNGITVTMDVNVETRQEDGQDIIKVVRVAAVSTLNGQSQMYETSVALLKNPNFNRTLKTDPDAPVVYFMPDAPDDQAVIWGDQHNPASPAPIFLRTKAFSPRDKIQWVSYQITGRADSSALATFTPDPMVQMYYSAPSLNTVSEGVADGFQTVSVTVRDDLERIGTETRQFIVDNNPPSSEATSIAADPLDSSRLSIRWNAAIDGGTLTAPSYASHYECEVSAEPTQGQAGSEWVVLSEPRWLAGSNLLEAITNRGPIIYEATVADGTKNLGQRAVPPFSRFEVKVRSSSPRNLTTNTWVEPPERVFTRPELVCEAAPSPYQSQCVTRIYGSGSTKYAEYDADLYVSRAGFQCGFSGVRWQVEYQSAATTPTPDGWTAFGAAIPVSSGYVTTVGDTVRLSPPAQKLFTDGRPVYLRVNVSGYTALRDGGGAVPTMYTNAAGPTLWGSVVPGVTTFLTPTWSY